MSGAVLHPDGLHRCPWPKVEDPVYVAYHDDEWGVPEYDDRALYERKFLVLDGFQAEAVVDPRFYAQAPTTSAAPSTASISGEDRALRCAQ